MKRSLLLLFALYLFGVTSAFAEGTGQVANPAGFATPATTVNTPKIFGRSGLVDKSMNPAISVNGLFLGQFGTATIEEEKGLQLQEIEAAFTAAVDPYFLANVILTSEGGTSLEVEEAYVLTLAIPYVTFKAGKMLVNFGKNNLIHTHAQPMIDRPLVSSTLLGEDGFSSVGVQASVLVPVPWYFDVSVSGVSARRAVGVFHTTADATPPSPYPRAENVGAVVRMEHLFDLSDVTTISLAGSFASGANELDQKTTLWGADATLKYVSGQGRGNFAVALTNEFISSTRNGLVTAELGEKSWGTYHTLLVRLGQQWWVGGRFDFLKPDSATPDSPTNTGESLLVAYVPTEFTALRFQTGLSKTTNEDTRWKALLQLNVTIGSHPAHAY